MYPFPAIPRPEKNVWNELAGLSISLLYPLICQLPQKNPKT